MDFGRGFSIPQGNAVFPMEDSWFPVTPEKSFPVRPNLIPADTQGSQSGKSNWGELLGIYTGFLQENANAGVADQNFNSVREFNGGSRNWDFVTGEEKSFDRNVGSYVGNFGNENAAWNNNPLAELLMQKRDVDIIHRPTGVNSYAQSEAASSMLTQQNRAVGLNQRINGCTLQQMPNDGFPIPYCSNYNRNSPPKSVGDAASSVTNPFPFAPVTPDQAKQLENHRLSEIVNHLIDDCSSQEKDKQVNLTLSTSEELENRCDELLQNIVDSSSAAVSRTVKEKDRTCNEGHELGIDLNKTPEQKTPPKRRKHRPKVVKEGKPKTTPKPAGPKNGTPSENPSGKRKYVRKKGLKVSEESENAGGVSHATAPNVQSKSCRRALNFDLENRARDGSHGHEEETNRGRTKDFNLNLDSQETEPSVVEIGQQNGHITENNQAGPTRDLNCSTNQMLAGHILSPEQRAPLMPQAKAKDHALNLIARNLNMRNVNPCEIFLRADTTSANVENNNPCQSSGRNGYNQVHQRGFGEIFFQTEMANIDERRGFKREYCRTLEQMHPRSLNMMDSPIFRVGDNNGGINNSAAASFETRKRMKVVNGFQAPILNMPSCTTPVKDFETGGVNGVYANKATSQINGRLLNSYFQRESASTKLVNGVHGVGGERRIYPIGPTQVEEERSRGPTRLHDLYSLTAMTNWNQLPSTPVKESPTHQYLQGGETCRVNNMSANKRNVGPTSSNQGSCGRDKVLQQQYKDASVGHRKSPMKSRGSGKQKLPSVDEITYRLNGLQINGRNNIDGQEKNALVLYNGDNRIVPYEEFDPIKKRKARPKVDLDPETDRIWKLLMGKEGSEGTEATDKDKEKWWEGERNVFRGRADSFIARMHLVQGDRRFSRWKGSVVDSVIGVFLTQNVSDHLSSSAFMSLAAKFPLQSKTTKQKCYENGTNPFVEEPEIQLPELGQSIKCHEKIGRQPMNNQSFITICKSPPDQRINNLSSWTRNSPNEHNRVLGQISSSHNYFDSTISQSSEEIRSSSGSNSEVEDRTSGCRPMWNHSMAPMNQLQTQKAAMFQQFYIHGGSLLESEKLERNGQNTRLGRVDNLIGSSPYTHPIGYNILHMQDSSVSSPNFQLNMAPHSEAHEMRSFGIPGEESISSLSRQAISTTHTRRRMDHMAESTTTQENGVLSFQNPALGPYAFLNQNPPHQGHIKEGRHDGNNRHYINNQQQERSKSFQAESTYVKEPIGPTGARDQASGNPNFTGHSFNTEERVSVFDKQNRLENNPTEATVKDKINSSGKAFNGTSTNIPNARKGKAEDEKNKAIDWDSLRKQAQLNGKKERSKDAMDSLDYEALRCADVNEISNAIKERGMNNMLAERIKDFLNRIVREHESIDLEWLRDVPPDKAKDYLLSVRGLGLKSVECVRLLTLHHLAFPVDTNVGRIAVRLGWVPLQPLPESLQLHLLEMYPVLESIQKYLWPRLCKLDQRTLYELHYQMITFGKVFCTKSKPNCNACPMRGECRHFASAFASARLALPGPEEKSIVSSGAPFTTDKSPPVMTKPLALTPAENGSNKEAGLIARNCEPIIEEPATPEPETTEITESDIEDAFYEDPDEIPTIKLDIEEFAVNLHNYMQDNMELQDGDMSKALVALNPEAASIPTTKLKNVSRLRTEHLVYELPDLHPLLKGFDKREPDDPSPYLLAIWTPGETANSVQAHESTCRAQESGKLCDDKACFSCNSKREANSLTVRGTILIPCRTAMRGSFPLNGTYFQVNEMFADHESSLNPIDVPRTWIWNLSRRTVYFGTSVSTIFKGLSTEGIQYCFWRGFVCVRGFDLKTRAPRPLMARLHLPASKLVKTKNEEKQKIAFDSRTANGSRY